MHHWEIKKEVYNSTAVSTAQENVPSARRSARIVVPPTRFIPPHFLERKEKKESPKPTFVLPSEAILIDDRFSDFCNKTIGLEYDPGPGFIENEGSTIRFPEPSTAVYLSRTHALQTDDKKTGYGVYALRLLKVNEFLLPYTGEVLSTAEQAKNYMFLFEIPKGKTSIWIDATSKGGLARFVNHSSEYNCVADVISDHIVFRVIKPIRPGEAVLINYGLFYASMVSTPLIALRPDDTHETDEEQFFRIADNYISAPAEAQRAIIKMLNLKPRNDERSLRSFPRNSSVFIPKDWNKNPNACVFVRTPSPDSRIIKTGLTRIMYSLYHAQGGEKERGEIQRFIQRREIKLNYLTCTQFSVLRFLIYGSLAQQEKINYFKLLIQLGADIVIHFEQFHTLLTDCIYAKQLDLFDFLKNHIDTEDIEPFLFNKNDVLLSAIQQLGHMDDRPETKKRIKKIEDWIEENCPDELSIPCESKPAASAATATTASSASSSSSTIPRRRFKMSRSTLTTTTAPKSLASVTTHETQSHSSSSRSSSSGSASSRASVIEEAATAALAPMVADVTPAILIEEVATAATSTSLEETMTVTVTAAEMVAATDNTMDSTFLGHVSTDRVSSSSSSSSRSSSSSISAYCSQSIAASISNASASEEDAFTHDSKLEASNGDIATLTLTDNSLAETTPPVPRVEPITTLTLTDTFLAETTPPVPRVEPITTITSPVPLIDVVPKIKLIATIPLKFGDKDISRLPLYQINTEQYDGVLAFFAADVASLLGYVRFSYFLRYKPLLETVEQIKVDSTLCILFNRKFLNFFTIKHVKNTVISKNIAEFRYIGKFLTHYLLTLENQRSSGFSLDKAIVLPPPMSSTFPAAATSSSSTRSGGSDYDPRFFQRTLSSSIIADMAATAAIATATTAPTATTSAATATSAPVSATGTEKISTYALLPGKKRSSAELIVSSAAPSAGEPENHNSKKPRFSTI